MVKSKKSKKSAVGSRLKRKAAKITGDDDSIATRVKRRKKSARKTVKTKKKPRKKSVKKKRKLKELEFGKFVNKKYKIFTAKKEDVKVGIAKNGAHMLIYKHPVHGKVVKFTSGETYNKYK